MVKAVVFCRPTGGEMRTFLALLAALPLLLPPGTCACQLAPQPPPPRPVAQRQAPCRCCTHGKRTNTPQPSRAKPAVPALPTEPPDCHCVKIADHTKPAEPPVLNDGLTPTGLVVGILAPSPAAAAVSLSPASAAASPGPLYLSHCALLI